MFRSPSSNFQKAPQFGPSQHLSLNLPVTSRSGVQEQPGLKAAAWMKIHNHHCNVTQVRDRREKDLCFSSSNFSHTTQKFHQHSGHKVCHYRPSGPVLLGELKFPLHEFLHCACLPPKVQSSPLEKQNKPTTSPVTRRWAQTWLWVAALSHSETSHAQPIKGNIQAQHHPPPKVEFSSTTSKQSWKAKNRMKRKAKNRIKKPKWGKEENTKPEVNIKTKPNGNLQTETLKSRGKEAWTKTDSGWNSQLRTKQNELRNKKRKKRQNETQAIPKKVLKKKCSHQRNIKNIFYFKEIFTFYKNQCCLTKKRLHSDSKITCALMPAVRSQKSDIDAFPNCRISKPI